jgi:hypothetical protein
LVIGLLGNTLGNLDRRENVFLHDVAQILDKTDFLVVDVSLKGPKWSWEADRKTQPDGWLEGERRFLATGLARVAHLSTEAAFDRLRELIKIDQGKGDMPGAHTIRVRQSQLCDRSRGEHFRRQ